MIDLLKTILFAAKWLPFGPFVVPFMTRVSEIIVNLFWTGVIGGRVKNRFPRVNPGSLPLQLHSKLT